MSDRYKLATAYASLTNEAYDDARAYFDAVASGGETRPLAESHRTAIVAALRADGFGPEIAKRSDAYVTSVLVYAERAAYQQEVAQDRLYRKCKLGKYNV